MGKSRNKMKKIEEDRNNSKGNSICILVKNEWMNAT